ncbi:hypothetical protein [Brevibacillus fulvus]|uniref:Uncharacterized protein n=1 Tax=Brevibacillus fulvus TaxID=1125967 RepID=A0A938XVY2_9BACL|nr:hypothetical protein [Brevibacillus fulvus]MBM7589089.1 hypothetical protein [Brevibacillus fulvus]
MKKAVHFLNKRAPQVAAQEGISVTFHPNHITKDIFNGSFFLLPNGAKLCVTTFQLIRIYLHAKGGIWK